jgi:hypothetical protein
MLLYSQNRTGYTFRPTETAGFRAQVYWNWNLTVDQKGEEWANYVENGPGVRFRFRPLPSSMLIGVNALQGHYLLKPAKFNDIRAGLWYAFTR